MKKTLPTLRIMMLKSCRLLLCLSACYTITQTKEIFNHYLSASLKWGQISKAWFCRSSWCIYSRRSCITWGCLHSCSSCSRCCVASPWPRVPGRSVMNSTHVVFRLNAGEQLCSCELLIATQSGWTWSEELWHCAAGHWSLWRWKPILLMCAEVYRFFHKLWGAEWFVSRSGCWSMLWRGYQCQRVWSPLCDSGTSALPHGANGRVFSPTVKPGWVAGSWTIPSSASSVQESNEGSETGKGDHQSVY